MERSVKTSIERARTANSIPPTHFCHFFLSTSSDQNGRLYSSSSRGKDNLFLRDACIRKRPILVCCCCCEKRLKPLHFGVVVVVNIVVVVSLEVVVVVFDAAAVVGVVVVCWNGGKYVIKFMLSRCF